MAANSKRLWVAGVVVLVLVVAAFQAARGPRDFKRMEALPDSPPLVKVPLFKKGQNAFLVYQKAAREDDRAKALKLVRTARDLPGFAWTLGSNGLPRKLAAKSAGLDLALEKAIQSEPKAAVAYTRDWLYLVRRLRRDPNVPVADLPALERRNCAASRAVINLPLKTLARPDLQALLADLDKLAGGTRTPRETLAHAIATFRLRIASRRFKETLAEAGAKPENLQDVLEHGAFPELDALLAAGNTQGYQERLAAWLQAESAAKDFEAALEARDFDGTTAKVAIWKDQLPVDWFYPEKRFLSQGLPMPVPVAAIARWQAADAEARAAVASELARRPH